MIKITNCTEIKVKKLPVTSGSVAAFTRFFPPLTTGNESKKNVDNPNSEIHGFLHHLQSASLDLD